MTTPVSGSVTIGGQVYPASASVTLPAAPVTPPPATSSLSLGIYDPADDWPSAWSGIQAFQTAGCPVQIGTYYVQWGGDFPPNFSSLCLANGVIPFVEMEPWYTSTTWPTFSTIASGAFDSYLTTFAGQVKAFGHPVWLTFGHEMNGSWYPWGNGGAQGVTPAQWIAAWNHVTSFISNLAPGLVTWVWAPNNNDVGAVSPYWAGDAVQNASFLAAYDGYLNSASATFANFQASTVAEIRKLTSGPIWNSECGVQPAGAQRAAQIKQFIADLKAGGVNGFNWWNQSPFNLTSAELSTFATAVGAWNAG